jgi:molecular chaperone GrpE
VRDEEDEDPSTKDAPPTGEEARAEEAQEGAVEAVPPTSAPGKPPAGGGGGLERDALRRERDELRDQLLRKRAEFENYRKRVERDRQEAGVEAAAALMKELIPTLDNLERALQAASDEASLRAGVEMIHREMLGFLERHGVTAHDPAGEVFDPQSQQALLHEAAPGFEEGTVVEVFRKGYSLKDRLLRPALVKVAKGDEEDPDSDSGGIHWR